MSVCRYRPDGCCVASSPRLSSSLRACDGQCWKIRVEHIGGDELVCVCWVWQKTSLCLILCFHQLLWTLVSSSGCEKFELFFPLFNIHCESSSGCAMSPASECRSSSLAAFFSYIWYLAVVNNRILCWLLVFLSFFFCCLLLLIFYYIGYIRTKVLLFTRSYWI